MTDQQNAMIDRVPRAADSVAVEVVEGEVLLYHPLQTRAVYLNPTAAVVWGLCDGNRSVRDIIGVIAENYPEAGASLTDDVLDALNELQGSGVLALG